MAIYISGSLAYDRVMNFNGVFSEYILPDKIHMINVCFPIGHMEEKRGGTGGNIAYNLNLFGEKGIILACAGKDFASYKQHLEDQGLSLDGINFLANEYTAGAYITTDKHANQITGFHAAAMNTPCGYPFKNLNTAEDIGIISPTNCIDMKEHAKLYTEKGVKYIFDPGQQITDLGRDSLLAGINGAYILIGNDYEIELISKLTGLSLKEMLEKAAFVITTMGEMGSKIMSKNEKTIHINAVPVSNIVDPTGAGDAFRAGLLKALVSGLGLEAGAMLGATSAAYCVEHYGTQEHHFDFEMFKQRFENTFKKEMPAKF